ncbi:MAG TPA: hypothetical protein VKR60_07625 [Candidatus Sulfotelmatobacter sp.]|nr:hypothetical protein [Candidatus Sulfotelmatobacter sp.]
MRLLIVRAIRQTLALLTLSACVAAAQQATVPTARQSLNDAWWTGPLLAPNATTLPRGHILIEPYLYDVVTQGFYDSHGTKQSTPHANEFGSLTYINYGLADKFTVGLIPVFGYNEVALGPNSSSIGAGDLTVQAQYRFHLFHEGSSIPTTSIAVQETLPTGKYDELGDRPNNGLGAGAYTTTFCFYNQTFFWMPNGRILRTRFNITQAFSRSVHVEDVSVYGTSQGFRGHANPGAALFVDAAWEYSVTRRWVLALDATYRHQYNTPVSGSNISDPNSPILLNSGPSQAFALAPAFEYNFNSKVGVILGTRLFPAGKNTTASITPVIAINIVH